MYLHKAKMLFAILYNIVCSRTFYDLFYVIWLCDYDCDRCHVYVTLCDLCNFHMEYYVTAFIQVQNKEREKKTQDKLK